MDRRRREMDIGKEGDNGHRKRVLLDFILKPIGIK